jgi:ATP-dependent Clp protease protease subunit
MPLAPSPEIDQRDTSQILQDAGIYVLMSDVSDESIKPIVEWILLENHVAQKKKKELLLIVCSEGGSVEDAFALIDIIGASTIPVKTVGLGVIASAGLMIFLAGHKGRRMLTPNTSIMSHQYSGSSDGKHHELISIAKEFTLIQQRMLNHYMKTTGMTRATVMKKLLPTSDVYLSAEEALKLGICDIVSDFKK